MLELLVWAALLLPLALVATGLSLHALRGTVKVTAAAEQEAALADAALVLEAELAPLTAGDGVLAIAPDRIRFRAVRAAGRWCQRDSAGLVVPTDSGPWAASRLPVPGRDSLVLEVADSMATGGYRRMRLQLTAPPSGSACPGGVNGLRLDFVAGGAPAASGELIQTEEVVELAAYVSAGSTWLGLLHIALGTPIEPVAGPFATGGIRFEGLDALGAPTSIPADVRTVRVALVPAGPSPPGRTVDVPLRG